MGKCDWELIQHLKETRMRNLVSPTPPVLPQVIKTAQAKALLNKK